MSYPPAYNVTGGYRMTRQSGWVPGAQPARELAPEGLALSATPDGLAAVTLTDKSGITVSLGFTPDTASQISLDLAALAAALRDGA